MIVADFPLMLGKNSSSHRPVPSLCALAPAARRPLYLSLSLSLSLSLCLALAHALVSASHSPLSFCALPHICLLCPALSLSLSLCLALVSASRSPVSLFVPLPHVHLGLVPRARSLSLPCARPGLGWPLSAFSSCPCPCHPKTCRNCANH